MTTEPLTPQDSESDVPSAGVARIKTVKAGCGIRFDPEDLNTDTGFDFSGAAELLEDSTEAADFSETTGARVNPEDS